MSRRRVPDACCAGIITEVFFPFKAMWSVLSYLSGVGRSYIDKNFHVGIIAVFPFQAGGVPVVPLDVCFVGVVVHLKKEYFFHMRFDQSLPPQYRPFGLTSVSGSAQSTSWWTPNPSAIGKEFTAARHSLPHWLRPGR